MAGFFKKTFGKGGEAPGGPAATRKAAPAAASDDHVISQRGSQWSRLVDTKDADGGTGPWFVGKTVAEIFQIRGVLGWGGMGIVYRAYDTATYRDVAVKVPLGKFVDNEDARKRCVREAKTWTGLIHPHIVHAFAVHDEKTTDYRPAIFMDYCDGGSLHERIYSGHVLPTAEALDYAIQIAWALDYAHGDGKAGLLHRDLKPLNVLLTKDGKALVTDFGLARPVSETASEAPDARGTEVIHAEEGFQSLREASISRDASGTPEYMPPEQWEGNSERRSDIYAFGVVLFELFCGVRPFAVSQGGDRRQLVHAHREVPVPDPRQYRSQLPELLVELILGCLAKSPQERPADFSRAVTPLEAAYHEATGSEYSSRRIKPSAIEISQAQKESQAGSLIRLGMGCVVRCDWNEAARLYAEALECFHSIGSRMGEADYYNNLGELYRARTEFAEAADMYRKAAALYRDLTDDQGLEAVHNNLGELYRQTGCLSEALQMYHESLVVAQKRNSREGIARSRNNIGIVLSNRGEHAEASGQFTKALTVAESLSDGLLASRILLNLGNLSQEQGNCDEAVKRYDEALHFANEVGDTQFAGTCHANLAVAEINRARYPKALDHLARALGIAIDLHDKTLEAGCRMYMGVLAFRAGEYRHALQQWQRCEVLAEHIGDKKKLAECCANMAALGQATKDQEMERHYASKSVKLFDELGIPCPDALRNGAAG